MSIENRRQLENTQAKLAELQQLADQKRSEASNDRVCELTLRSLQKRINLFKEEIARFESRSRSIVQE